MNQDSSFDDEFIAGIQNINITQRPSAKDEYAELADKFVVCKRELHGTKGTPIELLVNWFRMKLCRKQIYLYEVNIIEFAKRPTRRKNAEPVVTISRENARIAFWNAIRSICGDCDLGDVVFDDTVAFLPYEINPTKVIVDHPDEKLKHRRSVSVALRSTGRFFVDPLNQDVRVADFSRIFIKALVTQRTRALIPFDSAFESNWCFYSGGIFRIPRFVTHGSEEDSNMTVLPGVRAWLGLYASLKSGEHGDLFINFGLMNRLFYRMDIDLITFYIEICREQEVDIPPDFPERLKTMSMNARQRRRMTKLVSGLIVKSQRALLFENDNQSRNTSTREERSFRPFLATRNFKVIEIADKCARSCEINGFSIETIYRKLGTILNYPHLPLAYVSLAKKKYYLPLEVLWVHDTPQKYSKVLDFFESKKFIKSVCRTPGQYKEEIDKFLGQMELQKPNPPFLSNYGVQLDLNFTKCIGRVLDAPVIRDHEGLEHKLQEDRSYRIKEVSENPGLIVMDVIITIDPVTLEPVVDKRDAGMFYKHLEDKMRERGMEMETREPQVYDAQYIPDRSDITLYDEQVDLDEADDEFKCKQGVPTVSVVAKDAQRRFRGIKNNVHKRHIILIYSSRANDYYGRSKRICDRINGVVTQNVDRDTVQKALSEANFNKHAIFFNIALKINGKLGGINTRADVPIELHGGDDDLKTPSVMYVGIDVTHPGIVPGRESWEDSEMDASIAAMVASYDLGATRYKTYYMAQLKVKETIERFDNQFHHLMMDFFEINNAFPKHIVIYRDGVSNSEIIRTACIELNWIKDSWRKIIEQTSSDAPEAPTFTYIVVQKRHYTRFICPKDKNGTISYENMPSGTVVDNTIANSKLFDFWLTGQHGALGTSRPIHYTVVYDEWKRSPDHIYEMTYRLCFLNARCRKPCALPTPVYYAHLACLQGKEIYRDFVRHYPSEGPTPERQAKVEEILNVGKEYPGMPFV